MGIKVSRKEIIAAMTSGKASLNLDCCTTRFWLRHLDTDKLLFSGNIIDFFRIMGVKRMVDWGT